jgi:DUF4097 and DUF4098 domain-containing protein YvlB
MRLRIILISFLLFPHGWSQQPPDAAAPETGIPFVEREEKQFNFLPGGKLEITAGLPGSIRILGWRQSTVRLEAEKIVYYQPPEKARELLSKNPIRVRYTQTHASVQCPIPSQIDAVMEFNLTLRVPGDKTDVKVAMGRGDFTIESVNGWVEVTVAEGSLEARSMSGYFSGSSGRGDIYVEMSGKFWKGLEFAATTQHGSVDLRLPADYSAALQLETRDGSIAVDYPPRIVDGETQPPEILKRKNSQSLTGAVGEGGAPIKLLTHAGDIRLSRLE